METNQEKITQIKQTLANTRERRKSQICKTYALKIDYKHTNKLQKDWLKQIFLEAKWFYNHVLNQDDVFDISVTKDKTAKIKVLTHFEDRELKHLSSQMKQALLKRIHFAIKALNVLKAHSFSVGKLKFKPEINSIDLPQYKNTWKFKGNRIKIQGLKKPLKVFGIKQFPENCEFTRATIIRRSSGYYIQVTTFQEKTITPKTNKEVGLDFGIKDNIVTSDGEKFNINIPESIRLRRNQLYLSKKQNGSNKRKKQIIKIRREYEKNTNRKKDQTNKLVSYLTKKYDIIHMQNEQVANWHKGLFGRAVQHSALGVIKSKLKSLESTVVIDKWQPTTQLCPKCGTLNKHPLKERTYHCQCGYFEDRDIHSAKNILLMGQNQLSHSSMEHTCTTSEGVSSETNYVSLKSSPVKREALVLKLG